MEDIDIYIEEASAVDITIDENTAYVIEVPSLAAASVLTTKGDLLGYSTVPERHPIGTNGYVLTADSTEERGFKWAEAAGGSSNKIEQGNSYVEVVDTAAGVITLATDTHDLMTLKTLHQPITMSHPATYLDTNTPLVLMETEGSISGKGSVLWLKTNRSASPVDINVFRIDNSAGAIFSILNNGSMSINGGQGITEFSTDTTLGGNSDLALPTEKAVKTYVNTQIATIDVLTTKGDLHTYSTTDARLPVGTDGYLLTADSSEATGLKWVVDDGLTDPMTTRGDIIVRDATNTTNRLGIGSNGQVLTSNGTDVSWENAASGFTDPMTTRGDLIYKNSSGTTTRLPAGSADQVLTSDGTDIAWATISGGGGGISDVVDDTSPQLGGDLELNGHNLNYGSILTSNSTYVGDIITVTVDDASTAFGNVLYQGSDFHFDRADADATSTSPVFLIALESGSGTKKAMVRGQICNTAWNWSAGKLYLSATTGEMTQAVPSTTGQQIQVLGWALSADTIWFDPVAMVAEVD